MRRIVVVGGTGTLGSAVVELLSLGSQVICVGNSRGRHTVDLASKASIEKLMKSIGGFNDIICTAGVSRFGNINDMSDEDVLLGIKTKLLGQVNLARVAMNHIHSQGSITLTAGVFSREPWPGTSVAAMVDAGLEGFVRATALDVKRGIRINAVSPIFLNITAKKMGMDTAGTMSPHEAAVAYQAIIEGNMTGRILDVRKYGRIEKAG